MVYHEMCFAAEDTGAISLDISPYCFVSKRNKNHNGIATKKEIGKEWGARIKNGHLARRWLCDELIKLLCKEPYSTWMLVKHKSSNEDKEIYFIVNGNDNNIHSDDFNMPEEALLWAVMRERGWRWKPESNKFEKR